MNPLPAAIARLKADEYEASQLKLAPIIARHVAELSRKADYEAVGRALLDARPLTPEGLVSEFGFERNNLTEHRATLSRTIGGQDVSVTLASGLLVSWRIGAASLNYELWPQTHGDLASLILRMERE